MPGDTGLAAEFQQAMAAFGPFEPTPHLAVAVSGGADSLALCLLAEGWARERHGRVTALTVDHLLRRDSTAEATQVGCWLERRGIAHHRLTWNGPKPLTGIQAAARVARYRLLVGWCRTAAVGHLLVGHQAADQAETVLLRLSRASGLAGLAGMSPLVEVGGTRLLRPLLDVAPERLRAYLQVEGQPWIDDPSNRDPKYMRVRLRQASASLAAAGIDRQGLLDLATIAQMARQATEEAADALLAGSVVLHPAGFAWLEPEPWRGASRFIAVRALARLLRILGGRRREAADGRVERLLSSLICSPKDASSAATLCGCRLRRFGQRVLVWRENRGMPAAQALAEGGRMVWDGRYLLDVATEGEDEGGLSLEALGAARARAIVAARLPLPDIPKVVWPTLPCLVDARGVLCVPHLGYWRSQDGSSTMRVMTGPQQSCASQGSFLV